MNNKKILSIVCVILLISFVWYFFWSSYMKYWSFFIVWKNLQISCETKDILPYNRNRQNKEMRISNNGSIYCNETGLKNAIIMYKDK